MSSHVGYNEQNNQISTKFLTSWFASPWIEKKLNIAYSEFNDAILSIQFTGDVHMVRKVNNKFSALTLSQACEEMVSYKQSVGKSPNTISDYRNTFAKLYLFFGKDIAFVDITRKNLLDFFHWLQEDYLSEPDGVAPRGKIRLGAKTIKNMHTNLSSLWSWAVEEKIVNSNFVGEIKVTKPSPPPIVPFTDDEVALLMRACEQTRSWKTDAQKKSHRPTEVRDQAIIMLLFDTGIRASELCNLQFQDYKKINSTITVRGKGPGKDPKIRVLPVGKSAANALNQLLRSRLDTITPESPIFITENNSVFETPMLRDHLGKLLKRTGDRAGVPGVHPHRFRHTFAISYLRNGGNVFALQKMLGHTTLDMVKRYVSIATGDLENMHKIASPADNWFQAQRRKRTSG